MAVMAREAWTDERLDDFRQNVNQRFDEVDKKVDNLDRRMEAGFAEVRQEFRAVRGEMKSEFQAVRAEMTDGLQSVQVEIAALNSNLMQLTWGLIGTMLVAFLGTIVVAVATQM
jgi:CHASE3 domain sensor protein